MRLVELIDFEPKKSKHTNKSYVNKLSQGTSSKEIGSNSSFGKAFSTDSPKRLNQVTKIAWSGSFKVGKGEHIEDDAYLSYIKMIYDFEKNGHHNPYFPRIHDLKIIRASDNKLHYRVNIEKLYPFATQKIIGNEHLMLSLFDDMFNTEIKELKPMASFPGDTPSFNYIGRLVQTYFENSVSMDDYGDIKDPRLKEALKMIESIKNGFNVDIHSDNFMWRITGTRPQLVIIDPLA